MPTAVFCMFNEEEHQVTVMIGVDRHKGSEWLLGWGEQFPERTWAVENATGLGYLLAQQLVAAGERVVVVQPKRAARVGLLATESTNMNDRTTLGRWPSPRSAHRHRSRSAARTTPR
jgi:hypothetical protein